MTDGQPRPARRRRETHAERRELRAAVDDLTVILDAALRLLEARQRSVAEVRRRLIGAGYRAELVEGAIGRLLELGILDDAAFATAWVASRDRAHPRGARALRSELFQKGLSAEVIASVLEARDDRQEGANEPSHEDPGSADEEAARRLVARHARALARVVDPRKRRQRAYALLARHGFDPEIAGRVAADISG